MNTQRFNITLPRPVAAQLAKETNKSRFIAEALREKWEADQRAQKERSLALEYAAAAREEVTLAQEWDTTAGDGL